MNQLGIDFPINFFLQRIDSLKGECQSANLSLLVVFANIGVRSSSGVTNIADQIKIQIAEN